jgi:tRNA G18 (ribose-2'-O)-methylase SpoU
MDAMLLDPTSCDPLYRRVVRVSMGAVFSLPHARIATLPAGLAEIRAAGFSLVALDTDPESTPLSHLEITGRMALVLGAEGPGLSPATLEAVDQVAHIPMRPGIDSLNVAAAAAVAAYVVGGLDRS